jgi:RHS repeat-associated protein
VDDSAEGTVLNQYDTLDRLVAQTTSLGMLTYQHDAGGRRTVMTAPGQAPVTYGYDAASRLTSIVQSGQVVRFDYDEAGRRTQLTLPDQVSTDYRHDAASRLTALSYRNAAGPLGDLTYQYDAAGNRLAVGGSFARTLLPAPLAAATYDPANRPLTFGPRTLAHDGNGNLLTDGATTYVWDARNRLAASSGPGGPATFAYDALGRRSRTTIAGTETRVTHDALNPIQRVSGTGHLTDLLTGLRLDEFLLSTDSMGRRSLLADGLGSTVAETDAASAIAAEYTYEPFGRSVVTGTGRTTFQYTGRENDGTGLHYYRTRYYDPSLHRFISEDPLGPAAGLNAYTYVGNRPTAAVDPLGLLTIIVHGVGLQSPSDGYSAVLGQELRRAGETILEVHWNGNPLSDEGTSSAIQQIVDAVALAAANGEAVNIIGHSWGSVIVANTLANTGITVNHLITMGSPLSAFAAAPSGVQDWLNIGSFADPLSWASFGTGADQYHVWTFHTGYWRDRQTVSAIVNRIKGRK